MQTQRKPFMPLDPDLDNRMERLAEEKGVGRLEKPGRESGAGEEPASVHAGAPVAHTGVTHASNTDVLAAGNAQATPRSKMKTVNLELPDYLWTDLKIRAAHRQTSVRHVIMAALAADAFSIKETDMIEDGRRLRGSNKPH